MLLFDLCLIFFCLNLFIHRYPDEAGKYPGLELNRDPISPKALGSALGNLTPFQVRVLLALRPNEDMTESLAVLISYFFLMHTPERITSFYAQSTCFLEVALIYLFFLPRNFSHSRGLFPHFRSGFLLPSRGDALRASWN